MIPKIGSINAKKLIAYCGGIQEVFHQKKKDLLKIPGVGDALASAITSSDVLGQAEREAGIAESETYLALLTQYFGWSGSELESGDPKGRSSRRRVFVSDLVAETGRPKAKDGHRNDKVRALIAKDFE